MASWLILLAKVILAAGLVIFVILFSASEPDDWDHFDDGSWNRWDD